MIRISGRYYSLPYWFIGLSTYSVAKLNHPTFEVDLALVSQ